MKIAVPVAYRIKITVNGKIVGNNLNSQGIGDLVVLNKRKQASLSAIMELFLQRERF
nr:hypothetical protein [uncultured Blautia sp.]